VCLSSVVAVDPLDWQKQFTQVLLSALYQRCNNQDILSWWLVSFEPGRLLPPCRISRGHGRGRAL
jgi:hypothetical protein